MSWTELKALLDDVVIIKAISGFIGSAVSLKFIPGTWFEKVTMFLGGAAVSWYSSDVIASYLDMQSKAIGLVGFLVGVFGMTLISKGYEALTSLDAKRLASDAWDWLMRRTPKEKE